MSVSKQQKQVVLLYISSVAGLLVGFLASIINTRALVPEAYGDVRYVQNIISFVSSLLLFGYFVSGSRLLAIAKSEDERRRIRGVLCFILLIAIAIVMLSLFGFSCYSHLKGDDNMARLFLIAVPVCGNVLMLSYVNTVAQGDNQVGRIALGRFIPTAAYCVIAYLLFKHTDATSSRILALFNGIAALVLGIIIISSGPSFKSLKSSFRLLNEENKAYGLDVYIGSLVNVSTGYISGITLGIFNADNSEVGFYTLALTLAMPLSMLPSIIGTTYFKRFASENTIGKKIFHGSILVTLGSFVLFVILTGWVVGIFYDSNYSVVSRYAAILAIGTSMHGLADMINRFLGAHGQGKMLRNSAFISGTITVIGSFAFVYLWGINGAMLTKIIASALYLMTMIYYYYKYTTGDEHKKFSKL